MAVGIMFHHFYDKVHPCGQGAISANQLDRLISLVGRQAILHPQEWLEEIAKGGREREIFCLSFDDGLRCQFDVALPVLQAHGLTAFWFVYSSAIEGTLEKLEVYRYFRTVAFETIEEFYAAFDAKVAVSPLAELVSVGLKGFVPGSYKPDAVFYSQADRIFRYTRDFILGEKRYNYIMDAMITEAGFGVEMLHDKLWMTKSQIRSLHHEGHEIGLHSYTHPTVIAGMSSEDQRDEYVRNIDHLVSIVGQRASSMSHPCNSYDETTLAILTSLGITSGFRARPDWVSNHPLELPRQDHGTLMAQLTK